MTRYPIQLFITLGFTIALFASCTKSSKESQMAHKNIDVQGHRGARGLMPENTIPAFIKALELGVTTLELDLAVTKNKELLVSHEPFMNSLICLDPDGNEILKEDELAYNIYLMDIEEIQSYDCGTKFVKRFPEQVKLQVVKPLLAQVIDSVNSYIAKNNLPPVRYNIEIKSQPVGDDKYHPSPEEFSDLVYQFITKKMDKKMVNVQSFDFRVLNYFNKTYPDVELAVLIENTVSIDQNLDELGFTPQIYSCYYPLLDEHKIKYLQSLNMKVIPWTVNEKQAIRDMKNWGVDGIISDYPDRVFKVLSE